MLEFIITYDTRDILSKTFSNEKMKRLEPLFQKILRFESREDMLSFFRNLNFTEEEADLIYNESGRFIKSDQYADMERTIEQGEEKIIIPYTMPINGKTGELSVIYKKQQRGGYYIFIELDPRDENNDRLGGWASVGLSGALKFCSERGVWLSEKDKNKIGSKNGLIFE